jgi:hypothetical protein
MRKYFFNWTPSDVAAWEKIRAKGFGRFVIWYGVKLFGGGLFILLGGAVLLLWVKDGSANPAGLGLELLFVVVVCLMGGVINSLLTWAMEERIYQNMIKSAPETSQE